MPTIVVAPWLYTALTVILLAVNVVASYLGPYKDTIPQWVGIVLGGLAVLLAALLNVMREKEPTSIRVQTGTGEKP